MSRPLQLVTRNTPTRADVRLSVEVGADSRIDARRVGGRTEVSVSDGQGLVLVTLDLPDAEFRRLIGAMSEAWNGSAK